MPLAWIQEFIDKLDGDPKKVTLWGQSAGSLSITTHLATHPDRADSFPSVEQLWSVADFVQGVEVRHSDTLHGPPQASGLLRLHR